MHSKSIIALLLVALTACFFAGCGSHSVGTYGVTYNANGATSGDAPSDANRYQSDISVTVLGNPGNLQKSGYTFNGWNTNPGGSGTNYTAGQKFDIKSSNAILYASWVNDNAHTVTYDGNGSTGGSAPTDSKRYKAGFLVTVLGNTGALVRAGGYSFAGWNTKADGTGTVYTQGDTFAMGSTNVTLYANWSLLTTYIVTYETNNATSGEAPVDTTRYVAGYTVTVLGNTGSLSRAGYSFVGWNTLADGSGTTYTQGQEFTIGAANVTLYAKWSANPTYNVLYSGNGNTGGDPPVDTTHYEVGQTVTVLGNIGNLEKTGYAFGNWNTATDGSGTTYAQGATFTMGSSDKTLYAKWTITNYTVNFDSQGGSIVEPQYYHYGDKVTQPKDPTKTGNTFAGWFKESGCFTPWLFNSDIVTGETTLYAKWTVDQYTVEFDSQGGSFVTPETVSYGQKAIRPPDPTQTGKTFGGWYKDAECTESWDFDHEVVTANVVLYAKWSTTICTVTFDSQGGTPVEPQPVPYGGKVPMPPRPTNGQYALAGWFTAGIGGTKWTFVSDEVTADITLYAQWKNYANGDVGPAGGWVFYDKGSYSDGWRYMEAAPSDFSDFQTWGYEENTGATGSTVGTGSSNTDKIVATFGQSIPYAARSCYEFVYLDYNDWFLPSSDETYYMYEHLYLLSIGGFQRDKYWDSTDVSKEYGGYVNFRNGARSFGAKDESHLVRPARYF